MNRTIYLTEAQANQLSLTSVNSAPLMTCHAGYYMVVQVSAAATVANIKQGSMHGNAKFITKQTALLLSREGKLSMEGLYEVLEFPLNVEIEKKRLDLALEIVSHYRFDFDNPMAQFTGGIGSTFVVMRMA